LLTAIVVNWNGLAYLDRCLTGLLAQVPAPDEVVVVDNHSEDGSRELVAANFPTVRVVDTGWNGGPGVARNVGAREARGDLLLMLDNDVVLHPGALAELQRVLVSQPQAAMVQARSLCGDDESVVHYDGGDLHYLGTLVLHHWYRPLAEAPGTRQLGAAISLCFLIRKEHYLAAGGSDEAMFYLYEDTQFAYKLRMRGHQIWLAADARCTHLAGTAGLSMRGVGAGYPGRRAYFHSRNRYYVLLTCMRWRTLLLTLPAQLLYGVVFALFAHAQGHGRSWWRAKGALLVTVPVALRARRRAQAGRTVPDRDLLVGTAMTVHPGLADRGAKAWLRRSLDRLFVVYWRLVRWACG